MNTETHGDRRRFRRLGGIVVLGVDSNYTEIVIGLAIVLAVVVDQAKHRLTARVR